MSVLPHEHSIAFRVMENIFLWSDFGFIVRTRNSGRLGSEQPPATPSQQSSAESMAALARCYGVNSKTLTKWHGLITMDDPPMGPRERNGTAPTPLGEAAVRTYDYETYRQLRRHIADPLGERCPARRSRLYANLNLIFAATHPIASP
jgi:hypothetical protein